VARYNFSTDRKYAAKLVRVAKRPIENAPLLHLSLLRLEFAIYWQYPDGQVLESQGEFACRDLLVGDAISAEDDLGLATYAVALGVKGPSNNLQEWMQLADSVKFIELRFGLPESEGGRNPFAEISAFDPGGWTTKEYRYDRTAEWVTIGVAADSVGVSESTVRRRVDALEEEWGTRLIVRTEGTHRRIFLPLFMNVWED